MGEHKAPAHTGPGNTAPGARTPRAPPKAPEHHLVVRWALYLGWLLLALSPLGALYYALRAHFLDVERQRNKALESGVILLHYAETADGWRLALVRYPAAPEAPRRSHPVLLLHGLSANRLCFDLPDHRPSLAKSLAAAGYDVWVLEFRGSNLSFHPDFMTLPEIRQWTFHDYVDNDLPCAVDFILRYTGCQSLHCVGHSMGGIIAAAYATLSPSHARRIRSNVMIASSFTYCGTGSNFEKLVPLYHLAKVWPSIFLWMIPHGVITILQDLAAGLIHHLWPFYSQYRHSHADNVDLEAWRTLHRFGFHAIPGRVIQSLYSAAGKPSGLYDAQRVPYLEHMATTVAAGGAVPPTLMLGGTMDPQCPISAVQRTAKRLNAVGKGAVQVALFGVTYGHKADYNHCDFLLGRRAEREVYPVIMDFLADHDS
jgi:pimeloyl-ACP methyl ester carboxylesterase